VCNGKAITDEEGKAVGAVVAMHDITSLKEAEQVLQTSLAEKDFLMQELSHRVKNNLAMISALVNLRNSTLGGKVDLSDLKHQIDSIYLIHEKLFQTEDITRIDAKDYIRDLLSTIFSLSPKTVKIDDKIEVEFLHSRTAVSVGLIINEIATNAVKHGFTPESEARFTLALTEEKSQHQYVLVLSNSGGPFPKGIDPNNPETLGLRLVSSLVDQLSGNFELQREPHPVFTIRFPIE
jgi:two-component sensor histidine kinase